MITENQLKEWIENQMKTWPMLSSTLERMRESESVKELGNGRKALYQPWRIRSSAARTDLSAISSRSCFLCDSNRPMDQKSLRLSPDVPFTILANPYPILPYHLTIVSDLHEPQSLSPSIIRHFCEMVYSWPSSTIFYNGSKCGASAPDHLHFQAIIDWAPSADRSTLPPHFIIRSGSPRQASLQLIKLLDEIQSRFGITPEMVNLISWPSIENANKSTPDIVVIPRRKFRPDIYSDDTNSDGYMISPATLEMVGIFVTPLKKDFERIDNSIIDSIYNEVGLAKLDYSQTVRVGIVSSSKLTFDLHGDFIINGRIVKDGEYEASIYSDKIRLSTENEEIISSRFTIVPISGVKTFFTLHEVTIGKNFHWQRREKQSFEGSLTLIIDGSEILAINTIDIEQYLSSVISSEMSPTASLEFLKAHAVISRSWLIAQIYPERRSVPVIQNNEFTPSQECDAIVRWYDCEDHHLFDVCGDDHCQRYQGLDRIVCETALKAVETTRGQVLTDIDHRIVDARFSKCCGGVTEEFHTCWQPYDYTYLKSFPDILPSHPLPDLTDNMRVQRWIDDAPEAFCNCKDPEILSQVMNSYDYEDPDFYRWEQRYTIEELSELIHRRSGIDFGEIISFEPLKRGKSGRIYELRIIGSKQTIIVGKELEIRRWLSPTHLRSSAFYIEKSSATGEFIIRGAGWGHGVGLCQIGAAVMSTQGYSYTAILKHYFPGTHVEIFE